MEKALDDDFQGKFQVAPSHFGKAILLVQEGSTVHQEHIAGLEEPNADLAGYIRHIGEHQDKGDCST